MGVGGEKEKCKMLVFLTPAELFRREVEAQPCLLASVMATSPPPDDHVTFSRPLSSALETEIQQSNKALMSKSARLAGLEERVGRIRDAINKQVAYYESCS